MTEIKAKPTGVTGDSEREGAVLSEAAHSAAIAVAARVVNPPYPIRPATTAASLTLLAQFCSPTDEGSGVKCLNPFTLKAAAPH